MVDKKVFIYSSDSTIAIVEGIYNYEESTIKILSKKSYFKSKFFENHSKILQGLFSKSIEYQNINVRTNLLPQSDIYKLFLDYGSKISNVSIQPGYKVNIDLLKLTYRQLVDSNFKHVQYENQVLKKRVLTELNQKSFEEIPDYSFLCFYHASVPLDIPIYHPSYREQWEQKQALETLSTEPLFGGALTNRGLRDIFL